MAALYAQLLQVFNLSTLEVSNVVTDEIADKPENYHCSHWVIGLNVHRIGQTAGTAH